MDFIQDCKSVLVFFSTWFVLSYLIYIINDVRELAVILNSKFPFFCSNADYPITFANSLGNANNESSAEGEIKALQLSDSLNISGLPFNPVQSVRTLYARQEDKMWVWILNLFPLKLQRIFLGITAMLLFEEVDFLTYAFHGSQAYYIFSCDDANLTLTCEAISKCTNCSRKLVSLKEIGVKDNYLKQFKISPHCTLSRR